MRIIGNDQKNNGQNFWEILERIIGKISSIIGAGLLGFKIFIMCFGAKTLQPTQYYNLWVNLVRKSLDAITMGKSSIIPKAYG